MSVRTIKAPEGTRYLSDVLEGDTLPQNCLFDKVLTGCGGTYVARPWFIPIAKNSDGKLVAVNTLNGNVDYFYCENLGGMVQYRPQVLHRSYLIFSKGSETQKRILRDTLKQYWPDIYDELYKL